MTATAAPLVAASHNIMDGLQLPALIEHYRQLQDERSLHVLALQENRQGPDGFHADAVARALGGRFRVILHPDAIRLATIFDGERLQLDERFLIPLPLLDRLGPIDRLYIMGGRVKQKWALVSRLRVDDESTLTVVNFHLDIAGNSEHRLRQTTAIARVLRLRCLHRRVVVCGDTNCYVFRKRCQAAALARLLEPLSSLGIEIPREGGATHFFARQGEPMLAHRLCALAGKVGIDHPLRYDIIASDLPLQARGQVTTEASDHDLVWLQLAPQRAPSAEPQDTIKSERQGSRGRPPRRSRRPDR
ncbi:MAG: hypothetical protein MJD61_15480 [Proteobacteria bacterium]|nr:hypothetical protein [Pseudomonadota bacterium]